MRIAKKLICVNNFEYSVNMFQISYFGGILCGGEKEKEIISFVSMQLFCNIINKMIDYHY